MEARETNVHGFPNDFPDMHKRKEEKDNGTKYCGSTQWNTELTDEATAFDMIWLQEWCGEEVRPTVCPITDTRQLLFHTCYALASPQRRHARGDHCCHARSRLDMLEPIGRGLAR